MHTIQIVNHPHIKTKLYKKNKRNQSLFSRTDKHAYVIFCNFSSYKKDKFLLKHQSLIFVLTFFQQIKGTLLEAPHWDDSNEFPQYMHYKN